MTREELIDRLGSRPGAEADALIQILRDNQRILDLLSQPAYPPPPPPAVIPAPPTAWPPWWERPILVTWSAGTNSTGDADGKRED